MIKRGCALEGCHSPSGFNDFRLRPGAVGFFAPLALHRNYEAALHEFMSLDTPDVRQSRLVKKNLFRGSGRHRAPRRAAAGGRGPIDTALPAAVRSRRPPRRLLHVPEWHRIERQDHAGRAVADGAGQHPAAGVRVPAARRRRRCSSSTPSAAAPTCKLADATWARRAASIGVGNIRSALGPCSGLAAGHRPGRARPRVELRRQQAGVRGARRAPPAGWTCGCWTSARGQLPAADQRQRPHGSGPVRVHNFDPVFAPDGSLVFASTRAGTLTLKRSSCPTPTSTASGPTWTSPTRSR